MARPVGFPNLQALGGAPAGNAVYVDPLGGGKYTTLADALASEPAGAEIILVGVVESLNATVPVGTRIRGDHFAQEAVLSSLDGVSPTLTFAGSGTLREVTMVTPNTAGVSAIDCSGLGAGDLAVLFNVAIQGGGSGCGFKGAGSGTVAAIQGYYHNGGPLDIFAHMTSGTLIGEGWILNAGSANDMLRIEGGIARLSSVQARDSSAYTCTDLIDIDGGALIIAALEMPNNGAEIATHGLHVSGDGVSVDLLGSELHTVTNDIIIDGGLVGTGSRLHIFNEVDFTKVSIPAGYRDVADTRFNFGTQTGWATYVDTADTSGSPQVLAAGVREQWTNNAGTKDEDYRPGQNALWASDKITPSKVGEAYTLRVDFTIDPAQTQGTCTIDIDIGSDPFGVDSVIIVPDTFSLVKGAVAQSITRTYTIFCLATFVANGGAIGITCDKNADVYDKRITLVRIH